MAKAGIPSFSIGTSVNLSGNVNYNASYMGQEVFNTEYIDRSNAELKVEKEIARVNGRYGDEWRGIEVDAISGAWAPYCGDCLDRSTVGRNIRLIGGRSTYAGGDNPMTNNGKYSYSYVPDMLTDYPAIGHDRLGIDGLHGLLTDTRAIGADFRFVSEEFSIAFNPGVDSKTRINAGLLGFGLGALAMPKTLYQYYLKPDGVLEMKFWYNISSIGVTNLPNTQKY